MTVSVGLRFDILQRDNFTCRYCGKQAHETELEVDHIHPASRGGSDHPSNLVTACWPCNRGKGARPAPPPALNTWASLVGKGFVRWNGSDIEDCGVVLSDLGQGCYLVELHDVRQPVRYSDGRRIYHLRDMQEQHDGTKWFFGEDLAEARTIAAGFPSSEPAPRPVVEEEDDGDAYHEEALASLDEVEPPPDEDESELRGLEGDLD